MSEAKSRWDNRISCPVPDKALGRMTGRMPGAVCLSMNSDAYRLVAECREKDWGYQITQDDHMTTIVVSKPRTEASSVYHFDEFDMCCDTAEAV